jgi:hypothetical protein
VDLRSRSVYKSGETRLVYDRMPIWALYASLCKKDGRSRPSGEPNIHSPPSLPRHHVCAPLGVCTAAGRQWPLTTGAPTEPIAALGHPPGSRPGCGPMQKACRPTALRSVRHQRHGARHPTLSAACKPARLPAPKVASRSSIVRTFWTTAACFGRCWKLVYRQRLPPGPGMASTRILCAAPRPWGTASSPSARPSRAPCSHTRAARRSGHRPCPAIHVDGQVWPPIALLLNHRSVREPGPSLALS